MQSFLFSQELLYGTICTNRKSYFCIQLLLNEQLLFGTINSTNQTNNPKRKAGIYYENTFKQCNS